MNNKPHNRCPRDCEQCSCETPVDRIAFALLYVFLGMALTATIILSAASLT